MTVEHRHIETVIKSLRDAAAALDQHRHLNVLKLRTVVEFLRIYADHRHHQREEATKKAVPSSRLWTNGSLFMNSSSEARMLNYVRRCRLSPPFTKSICGWRTPWCFQWPKGLSPSRTTRNCKTNLPLSTEKLEWRRYSGWRNSRRVFYFKRAPSRRTAAKARFLPRPGRPPFHNGTNFKRERKMI